MPLMPLIHDVFWISASAILATLAWKMSHHFKFSVPTLDFRRPDRAAPSIAPGSWFTSSARSSGNTAFDDWRDREIARLEAERQKLEGRLHAFEAFVDKLKRAKDRETFDHFMATVQELPSQEGEVMRSETTRLHEPV